MAKAAAFHKFKTNIMQRMYSHRGLTTLCYNPIYFVYLLQTEDSQACLSELTWRGAKKIHLGNGIQRRYLEDDDEVTLSGERHGLIWEVDVWVEEGSLKLKKYI